MSAATQAAAIAHRKQESPNREPEPPQPVVHFAAPPYNRSACTAGRDAGSVLASHPALVTCRRCRMTTAWQHAAAERLSQLNMGDEPVSFEVY